MTTTLKRKSEEKSNTVDSKAKTTITVFHCFNALGNVSSLEDNGSEIKSIKMPCSGMTREVFLLKAFEAGADAVVVLVCPEGACDYVQGNIRARKRVERVKKLLDEIGIGGEWLNIYNIPQQDMSAVEKIIEETKSKLIAEGRKI